MPNLTPEDRESFEQFIDTLNQDGNLAREYLLDVAAQISEYCGPHADLPNKMDMLRVWFEDVADEWDDEVEKVISGQ